MKRLELITLIGRAAATWPLAAQAQQRGMPVIGYLHAGSPGAYGRLTASFLQGLKEAGFTEVQNLSIEYRWAEGWTI